MSKVPVETVLEVLKDAYENKMPFNKLLGIKMDKLDLDGASVSFIMRNDLIGNFEKEILHGGVISAVLDFTGGAIAQMHVLKEMQQAPGNELAKKLSQMGTIDMRMDFIRPGRGDSFLATGHILRLGHKVAVVRTELHNNENVLIAAGTGTYIVG